MLLFVKIKLKSYVLWALAGIVTVIVPDADDIELFVTAEKPGIETVPVVIEY